MPSPSTPRPRPPSTRGRRRRRLQEHGRGRELERGEHGADVRKCWRPVLSLVRALAIDPTTPTTLYAGTDGRRRLQEHGRGRDLERGEHGADGRHFDVYALAIDPTTPTTLYAGTATGGVFKSTDGGATWSAVNTGLPCDLSRAASPPSPSIPRPRAPSTRGRSGGVFKSTDGGATWSAVNTGCRSPRVSALAIDPTTPTTLYAGTDGGGVFKSTDGGASWSAANTGLTVAGTLATSPPSPSIPRPRAPSTRGRARRRLQEHGRGRDLERGEHGAALWSVPLRLVQPSPSIPRPRPPSTRGRAAASSRARTGARPGARRTRG